MHEFLNIAYDSSYKYERTIYLKKGSPIIRSFIFFIWAVLQAGLQYV